MDMMLDRIAARHGIALAQAISDQLIYDRMRPASAPQRTILGTQTPLGGPVLQRLIKAMERGIEQGQSLVAILAAEGLQRRRAERLFLNQFNLSPARFYRALRIRHAIELMRQTQMSVQDAALAAGFSSQPVFSRACRQHFGLSPREILAKGEVPLPT